MTREEALSIGAGLTSGITKYSQLDSRIESFVNDIYNSLEERVCINCKHTSFISTMELANNKAKKNGVNHA